MQAKSDARLLREYADHGAEAAFTEIVNRHTNLVYSAALRQTDSPDTAAEVTQIVFIGLARGAGALAPRLGEDASLAGWLCRSARNISLNLRRNEFRQHSRERQAMEQLDPNPETAPDWERLRAVLDDAMSKLTEADYDALVMRFFNNQDLRAIGQSLGVSDDAAQKRVSRALDKLREHLSRRGISAPAAALSVVLSANAIQAAPAGLAVAISTAAALTGAAVTAPTLIAATKTIAMTTLQKVLVTATLAAAIGTGIYEARQNSDLRGRVQMLQQQMAPLADQMNGLQQDRDDATGKLAALRQENERLRSNLAELLKLRGEVGRLRENPPPVNNDPAYVEYKSQLERVDKLKRHAADNPAAQIPEFRYLTEDDYMSATRSMLSNEGDYLRAMANLRSSAQFKFITKSLNPALTEYARVNNGQFPKEVADLRPYFTSPVEEAILQRWMVAPGNTVRTDNFGDNIITPRAAVDEDFDFRYAVGLKGFASAGRDTAGHNGWGVIPPETILEMAGKAYLDAHNGQRPADPSEILPYLTTPEQQAAYQKFMKMEGAKIAGAFGAVGGHRGVSELVAAVHDRRTPS